MLYLKYGQGDMYLHKIPWFGQLIHRAETFIINNRILYNKMKLELQKYLLLHKKKEYIVTKCV